MLKIDHSSHFKLFQKMDTLLQNWSKKIKRKTFVGDAAFTRALDKLLNIETFSDVDGCREKIQLCSTRKRCVMSEKNSFRQ